MAKLWRVIDRGVCQEIFFLLTPSVFPCPQSSFVLFPGLFFFPLISICLALSPSDFSVSPPRSARLLPCRAPSLFLSLSLCVFLSWWFFLLPSPSLSLPVSVSISFTVSDSVPLSLPSPLSPVLMLLTWRTEGKACGPGFVIGKLSGRGPRLQAGGSE